MMDGDQHLREAINASRRQLKLTQRSIRASLQFLADLDEQLDAAEPAQPNERHRGDTNGHQTAHGRIQLHT